MNLNGSGCEGQRRSGKESTCQLEVIPGNEAGLVSSLASFQMKQEAYEIGVFAAPVGLIVVTCGNANFYIDLQTSTEANST